MTILNETVLDGTPLAAPGVWYTANIADSSFVDDVKVRLNEYGPAEAKFILRGGAEYVYKITDDFAQDIWSDLNAGYSPGGVFREVKDESRYTPTDYKAQPAVVAVLIVSGDVRKVEALRSHALFMGLTIGV